MRRQWPDQTDGNLASYGVAFFYVNGVLVPRGSLGTTPWMQQLDLTAVQPKVALQ